MLGGRPWRTWRAQLKQHRQTVNSRQLIQSKMEMNAKVEMFRETVEGQVKTEVREAGHGGAGRRATEMAVQPRQAATQDVCICLNG